MMLCRTDMAELMPDTESNLSSSEIPGSMPSDRRYWQRPSSKMLSNTMLDFARSADSRFCHQFVLGDGNIYIFKVMYLCAFTGDEFHGFILKYTEGALQSQASFIT
jgi:hypothetical protein